MKMENAIKRMNSVCDRLIHNSPYVNEDNVALITMLLSIDQSLVDLVNALRPKQTEAGSVELTPEQIMKIVDSLSFKPIP